MLTYSKHKLDKYKEHAEDTLGTYLQNADYSECIYKASLPIGVNNRGKEKKESGSYSCCGLGLAVKNRNL